MMSINDDQSEAVDWGDGDDAPEETAESFTADVEADAVSLASDDDDLEALKKYHHSAWDDSREPPASDHASQDKVDAAAPAIPETQESQESNVRHSTKESAPNPHGLPPKPRSDVYSKGSAPAQVSTSATSMALRDARANGNHNSPEPREANRRVLPPGWEVRYSHKGEEYYYHDEAGRTQWDFPTTPVHHTHSTGSHERSKRVERTVVHTTRRSRSRERRPTRRSLSPPRGTYRPRSRSVERDNSYRSARRVSPKRESSQVPRELVAPRIRSRPSSRERRPSPKPSRTTARRSRSPARVRESRDDPRQDSRQESSHHHHQSSRHRSPIARARSQERDSYRPTPAVKPPMDIDHREQLVHGTVRRRRSWGSPDPTDSKRRRVAASPPPPRGVDRYVPERSSRMDIDPPTSRQETKRSAKPDTYERTRESQASLPQPPPRERRDRPAGDREHNHSGTSQGQRTSPPHHLNATESSSTVQRSRAPLPSQADAMRFGNVKKPRHVPMDVDVTENVKAPDPEQALTGSKVGRPRGRGRSRSPGARPYEESSTRSKGGLSAPSGSYDQPPKVDRPLHREVAPSVEMRNGSSSRPPLPPDPFNPSQRGRGSSRPGGAFSRSNLTPLAKPKVFGRPAETESRDEVLVRTPGSEIIGTSEQSSTSAPDAQQESIQNNEQAHKRPRASRFGPPPKIEAKADEAEAFENKPAPAGWDSYRPARTVAEMSQMQDEPRPVGTNDSPPSVETLQQDGAAKGGFQRDLPPHVPNPEQDQRRLQHPRREDGLRIDRNRTSKSEGSERAVTAADLSIEIAEATQSEALPYSDGEVVEEAPQPVTGRSVAEVTTTAPSDGGGEVPASRSPTLSPGMEGSKPAAIHQQSSLLERISGARYTNDNEGDSLDVDGDEGIGNGNGTDKTRRPRGKRSSRGGRR